MQVNKEGVVERVQRRWKATRPANCAIVRFRHTIARLRLRRGPGSRQACSHIAMLHQEGKRVDKNTVRHSYR